jgi:hypothetical protein
MREVLIATVGLMITAPLVAEPVSPVSARCGSGANKAEHWKDRALAPRALGQEPPAARVLTLYRKVDGCPAPIVLEKGIGANADRAPVIEGEARLHALDR